jgi:hypothetical protein
VATRLDAVLRYHDGLSDAQIADVLGCAETTVRGYAFRGLAALRIETTTIGPVRAVRRATWSGSTGRGAGRGRRSGSRGVGMLATGAPRLQVGAFTGCPDPRSTRLRHVPSSS